MEKSKPGNFDLNLMYLHRLICQQLGNTGEFTTTIEPNGNITWRWQVRVWVDRWAYTQTVNPMIVALERGDPTGELTAMRFAEEARCVYARAFPNVTSDTPTDL